MTRAKETFAPIDPSNVRMYVCGPTVYDHAHVGNFRAFLTYDLVKRVLQYFGYRVTHVCNLTDVDDMIVRRATETGVGVAELTERFARLFFDDLAALHTGTVLHLQHRTIGHLVALALAPVLIDQGHLAGAGYRDQVAAMVLHELDVVQTHGAAGLELHAVDRGGSRSGAADVRGHRGRANRAGHGAARPHAPIPVHAFLIERSGRHGDLSGRGWAPA